MFKTLDELGVDPQQTQLTEIEVRQLAEQIHDEFLLDYFRSVQGWNVIGGQSLHINSLDDNQFNRNAFVLRSRVLARREPLSKQAIRLYTTYSGILKVEFKSESEEAIQVFKEKFWNLDANSRVLKSRYRRRLSNNLLTDGEIFFPLFPSQNGELRIRTIDPLQIPVGNILTHPEDKDTPLYYKRIVPAKEGDDATQLRTTGERVLYYRDWELDEETLQGAKQAGFELPPNAEIAQSNGQDILMFHLPFDAHGLRGNGLLFAILSYAENFRNFLQDRATIVRGLSTYIRTVTLKSGSKAVKDVASRLQSSLALGNTLDTNPPDAVGSNWVQNQNSTKEDTPPVTNAGEALSDARIFRQPIAAGTGITEPNLTGDPSIGNLASQTQMEGPQLQNFLDYQQLWEEAFKDLWIYVLRLNNVSGVDDTDLDVSMPEIVRPSLSDMSWVLTTGLGSRLIPRREAARVFMMSLGVEDIEKQIKALDSEKTVPIPQDDAPQFPQRRPVLPNDMREHGRQIAGRCPACGVEGGLIEEHGMNYCNNCQITFVPESQQKISRMVETLQSTLTSTRLGNGNT